MKSPYLEKNLVTAKSNPLLCGNEQAGNLGTALGYVLAEPPETSPLLGYGMYWFAKDARPSKAIEPVSKRPKEIFTTPTPLFPILSIYSQLRKFFPRTSKTIYKQTPIT